VPVLYLSLSHWHLSPLLSGPTPGYFEHISITTPVISASEKFQRAFQTKNQYFWIQVAVSEAKRPLRNRFESHSPTDTSASSGVTVMYRQWPLANILVLVSLTGIISVRLLRSYMVRGSVLKERGWSGMVPVSVGQGEFPIPHRAYTSPRLSRCTQLSFS
jgi:hypothetical protein